ncbi:hypothetical protein APHNP_0593 [Anaplasma phagocytophilum str. ApNP]|uniref:Uncharacterized protein n=1 Tax=Anaplasma phagocytophilum str. ApNP TaxID=1359153 RepID=A0A0F3NIF8_ANAPH|nr:hypothetical protein APHNP_0593 [Anaplasma phagocytophilum str. ApNP]
MTMYLGIHASAVESALSTSRIRIIRHNYTLKQLKHVSASLPFNLLDAYGLVTENSTALPSGSRTYLEITKQTRFSCRRRSALYLLI